MFRQTSRAVVRLNYQAVRTSVIVGGYAWIWSLEHLHSEMLRCGIQVRNIIGRVNDGKQISIFI
jgi:hypothetical protein